MRYEQHGLSFIGHLTELKQSFAHCFGMKPRRRLIGDQHIRLSALLCRLGASVPPPGFHLVHYAGVLGSASKLRALVVPAPPQQGQTDSTHSLSSYPPTHRSRYRPWAELMKRTFQIEVEQCLNCGGRLKLRSLVIEAHDIERLLHHIGEPLEPPKQVGTNPAARADATFHAKLQ